MYEQLREIIANSKRLVFFGGAGVSTESGIPDFRSQDGLYSQKYSVPPETILSHSYFVRHTEEFFNFYRDKMLFLQAQPNDAHKVLSILEQKNILSGIITQNIDGLHQMAGSRNVQELHGSVHRNYCTKCGKSYSAEDILNSIGIPKCTCGGIIKPDVVLYEEPLDESVIDNSISLLQNADTLIVAGTSLTVYPAAGMIRYFGGKNMILINKSQTDKDHLANMVIRDSVGKVLREAVMK